MQLQIQALLAKTGVVAVAGKAMKGFNMGSNIEVAKLPVFNREVSRVMRFIMVYKLYLRMKTRGALVEKQIQWVLSYV